MLPKLICFVVPRNRSFYVEVQVCYSPDLCFKSLWISYPSVPPQRNIPSSAFFPQALLAGFSFRTGEYKAVVVRKIAAKPGKVPILHKILLGNVPGNLLGNVPGPFFGKKCENPRYFFFLTFDVI